MFALTMRGVQQTLVVIFVLAVLATTIGVLVGAIAGYYGRWMDSVLMRFTDVILIIPLLLIAAVAGFRFGASGVWTVALVLGILLWTSWPGWCGPSSWPCASGSSSTRRGWPARRTGGSSSSTSFRTRWARSSSASPC